MFYYRIDLEREEWKKLRKVLRETEENYIGDEDFNILIKKVFAKKKINSPHRKVASIQRAREKRSDNTRKKVMKAVRTMKENGIKITYAAIHRESRVSINAIKKYYTHGERK